MYIKVKVTANANKEKIEKRKEDYYFISVKQKAERNMANDKVCEIIAKKLNVPEASVRIINGHQHRSKIISIKDF